MMWFLLLVVLVLAGVLGLVGGLRYVAALERRDPVAGGAVGRADLQRIQDAMVALESRLERLEDNQRFLEGLLEERPARPSLTAPEEPGNPEPEPERGVDSVLFDVEPEER